MCISFYHNLFVYLNPIRVSYSAQHMMSDHALLGLTKMSGCERCSQDAARSPSRYARKQQVTKVTFNKSQRELDRECQMLSWLHCKLDCDNLHVASLHCTICRKYKGHFQSLKSFNTVCITGSTTRRVAMCSSMLGAKYTKPRCHK